MGVEGSVAGFPRGIAGQELGHVCFGPAGLTRVEEVTGLPSHEVCGFEMDLGLGQRELHTLVHADWAVEYHPLVGIRRRTLQEEFAIADALAGDQNALGVHAAKDLTEAVAFFANQCASGDLDIVEEHLGGRVVHHRLDRIDGETIDQRAVGFAHLDQERGQAAQSVTNVVNGCGASK